MTRRLTSRRKARERSMESMKKRVASQLERDTKQLSKASEGLVKILNI